MFLKYSVNNDETIPLNLTANETVISAEKQQNKLLILTKQNILVYSCKTLNLMINLNISQISKDKNDVFTKVSTCIIPKLLFVTSIKNLSLVLLEFNNKKCSFKIIQQIDLQHDIQTHFSFSNTFIVICRDLENIYLHYLTFISQSQIAQFKENTTLETYNENILDILQIICLDQPNYFLIKCTKSLFKLTPPFNVIQDNNNEFVICNQQQDLIFIHKYPDTTYLSQYYFDNRVDYIEQLELDIAKTKSVYFLQYEFKKQTLLLLNQKFNILSQIQKSSIFPKKIIQMQYIPNQSKLLILNDSGVYIYKVKNSQNMILSIKCIYKLKTKKYTGFFVDNDDIKIYLFNNDCIQVIELQQNDQKYKAAFILLTFIILLFTIILAYLRKINNNYLQSNAK